MSGDERESAFTGPSPPTNAALELLVGGGEGGGVAANPAPDRETGLKVFFFVVVYLFGVFRAHLGFTVWCVVLISARRGPVVSVSAQAWTTIGSPN